MAVNRKVEWSARAIRDLDNIHAFVLAQWTTREADRLLDLVQDFEFLIARWPNGFKRSSRKPEYRLGIVHRNTIAVYRVFPDRIVIITLFDSRSEGGW